MPKRSSKPEKRPRDANQLAKVVVDLATRDRVVVTEDGKNAAAVALGRLGGLRGGKARAEVLSKERRREIAALAAEARWNKDESKTNSEKGRSKKAGGHRRPSKT